MLARNGHKKTKAVRRHRPQARPDGARRRAVGRAIRPRATVGGPPPVGGVAPSGPASRRARGIDAAAGGRVIGTEERENR